MPETYSIDIAAFRALAAEHAGSSGEQDGSPLPYTPFFRRIPADLDTPVSALLKMRRGDHCFLLESVERGNQVGRYSFLGTEPRQLLSAKDGLATLQPLDGPALAGQAAGGDPLAALDRLISSRRLVAAGGVAIPPFCGGAVGYAGYEIATSLEPVHAASHDPLALPDLAFALYDTLVVFDHVQRTAEVITLAPLNSHPDREYTRATGRIDAVMRRLREPLPAAHIRTIPPDTGNCPVRSNCTEPEFERMVAVAKEHIAAGDIIQVVLSQRFERHTSASPLAIYRALRMVNPSPYMFFLQFGGLHLIGASPEMLVQVRDQKVTTHPIAGTRPRGHDREEDVRLERELLADEKERAEHLMLVDLGRNDIGRVAAIGSVQVPRFMQVDHYSHVMHLVSEVEGEVRSGLGPIDVLRACFPAGTVSGAPKVRAMQIISELERDRRGPYAGAAGYIGYDGNMDTAIAIRTIALKDGLASIQAGAGIVADSVPATEYAETRHKAQALLAAIDLAEEIERDESFDYAAIQAEPAGEQPHDSVTR
ncbi:MAG: anthranilate synthase component I [Chloroflexia bacterium]